MPEADEQVVSQGESVDILGASKLFGEKAALDNVHLHIDAGTFLVLLGPSGSGKTTLLRCLAGIERLTEGSMHIGDRQVAGPGVHLPPERRRLAMVFQDYALWPHMTARRNVTFPLQQLRISRAEARQRASAMLERVGLSHLAEHYPSELSGGEQQRVALARALVGGVGLLLFDEPLSNLDADLREHLRLEISTLARDSEATSVYITHDQTEAFALADRVGVLRDGRLVQLGTPEELYRRPTNSFVARFTGITAEVPISLAGPAVAPPRDVVSRESQLVTVRLAGGSLTTASLPVTPKEGEALSMFVRPAAARIVAPADGDIMATVRDVAFCGRGYEYALIADEHVLFTKVFSEDRWQRGSPIGVSLNPDGCIVLETRDSPTAKPAGDGRLGGPEEGAVSVTPKPSSAPPSRPSSPSMAITEIPERL